MSKRFLAFSLAILGAVVGWQFGLSQSSISSTVYEQTTVQTLPDSLWENLNGGQNRLTDWSGKILIVNHWATWCTPCREEIPMFMEARQRYEKKGLELIGIAHDDEDEVRRYVDSMGMDYPQLLAGLGQGQKWLAELGGNGSLPFTLVFDREGNLRAKKLGLMSEQELHRAVGAIL